MLQDVFHGCRGSMFKPTSNTKRRKETDLFGFMYIAAGLAGRNKHS
jgi:hypothetical protein